MTDGHGHCQSIQTDVTYGLRVNQTLAHIGKLARFKNARIPNLGFLP